MFRTRAAKRATLLLAALAAAVMSAGTGCNRAEPDDARLRIVASIHPLADLARQVVGDQADGHVGVIVPPGATPHGFEMTTDRVRDLARAEIVLVVGLGLDAWADRAAASVAPDARVLSMAQMLGRDDHHSHDHAHNHDDHHHHAGPNPHLWLDPVLAERWVLALGEQLARVRPEQAEHFRGNAAAVAESLRRLHAEHEQALADVPRRQLVTFHNAFDLLAERYGLEVVAHLTPVELSPGGEVVPARLRAAINAVRTHELDVVYAEPQFPDAAVRALQRETGVQVLRLDPIGHPGRDGYDSYQAMMRSNLATLVQGQGVPSQE